jgi:hypothetical protein
MMATQQNAAAVPRRDPRAGGALDGETRQQVTELNRRAIDALCELLAADPRVPRPQPVPEPVRRRRRGPPARASRPGARIGVAAAPAAALGVETAAAVPGASRASVPQVATGSAGVVVPSPTVPALGPAWLVLDDAARAALAACPYLLVELDVPRLLGPCVPAVRVSETPGVPPATAMAVAAAAGSASGESVPWAHAARMVFQYAWHFARVSPVLAGFVLGLPGRDVDALRGVRLSQADALLPRVPACVALRWRDDVALWSGWLAAAQAADPAALRACELRGLQRLAGACRLTLPQP